jgi:hypothetical protein
VCVWVGGVEGVARRGWIGSRDVQKEPRGIRRWDGYIADNGKKKRPKRAQ